MDTIIQPFDFKQCISILKSSGKKARKLRELRLGIEAVGGDTGGIPLQITHGVNAFLVSSEEGAAFRIRQLLNNPEMAKKMGDSAKEYVRTNFLMTRQIRDYLSVWYSIENKGQSAFEL